MPDDSPALLSFGVDRARRALREHATGRNVLAVLTDSTADQWHRGWRGDATQMALVDCLEFTRGAAATARTNVVSDELVVTEIERPLTADRLRSACDRFFDGWAAGPRETVVYVESLTALREEMGREALASLLARFDARAGSALVAAVPDERVADAVAFGDAFTETIGEPSFDSDAPTAVRRLRATDPTTFGYFRRYWRDAIEILDRVDRSYVQAGQLDTELSARTLGATLSALTQLDALSVRADTNGPNRYDCRSYDPERAAELGLAVELLPD